MSENRPRKVFISYSWDSDEHIDKVLHLSDQLRDDGVECLIDQYIPVPNQGWQKWMKASIAEADYVLIVCTERYKARFDGTEEAGHGHGGIYEGSIITTSLYDEALRNTKYVPIVFEKQDRQHIPTELRPTVSYVVDEYGESQGYKDLYGRILGEHHTEAPPLGPRKPVSKRPRVLNSLNRDTKVEADPREESMSLEHTTIDVQVTDRNWVMCPSLPRRQWWSLLFGVGVAVLFTSVMLFSLCLMGSWLFNSAASLRELKMTNDNYSLGIFLILPGMAFFVCVVFGMAVVCAECVFDLGKQLFPSEVFISTHQVVVRRRLPDNVLFPFVNDRVVRFHPDKIMWDLSNGKITAADGTKIHYVNLHTRFDEGDVAEFREKLVTALEVAGLEFCEGAPDKIRFNK